MTEYFKKVYITSEADLPEGDDSDEYICHQRRLGGVIMLRAGYIKEHWKSAFDWYLMPITHLNDE